MIDPRDVTFTDYLPGAVGRIIELHGTYYGREWGFGLFFESRVATELCAFLGRRDAERDFFCVAAAGDAILGSITIDGSETDDDTAHLRWFIVAPEAHGLGIGKALMERAMAFCRARGFSSVHLYTLAGLDAAEHLYRRHGFRVTDEFAGDQWGRTVTERRMEATLA